MRKKILGLVLVISLLTSLVSFPTVALANQADDIVWVASQEVGYLEDASSGWSKYGEWYGFPTGAWCAMFICWCANQAGVSTDIIPRFSLVGDGVNWFQNKGQWRDAGSYPQKGDIIFFGTSSHVGIVESVSGDTVYTIEGNAHDGSYRNYGVRRLSYSIYNSWIQGYGVPSYGGNDPNPPKIKDFRISNATGKNFTIKATLSDDVGVASAWLNVYGPNGSKGYSVSASNGEFKQYIKYSDYGGYGKYSIHLYVKDSAGNEIGAALNNMYPSAGLGDSFYAVIGHVKSWKPIGVDSDNFVRLGTEDGTAKYVWKFKRQRDGSYIIQSAFNGKVLDVEGAVDGNGANLQVWEDKGNNNQRWMPLEQNGGYVIYPRHSRTRVLDLDGGQTADGAKIQLWDRHDGENQIFSIWKGDNVQLKGSTFTVKPGTSATSTVFDWNNVYGCRWFDLKIWNGTYWVGDAYHLGWGVKQPYSIKLPAGHYEAYVDSTNAIEPKMSNIVKFDIAEDSSDINIFSRRTVTDTGYDIHADIKYLTQSAVYAAALYSSDGKLLDVQSMPISSGATSADVAFTKQAGAAYVKIFLWDSLQSMQPLTESERINL